MAEELLDELADDLAGQVAQRYRIEREAARDLILADWRRQPKLVAAAVRVGSADELRRLRIYRDAAASTKRDIYHRLRRYRAEPTTFDDAVRALADGPLDERLTAVAAAHVSTAERLAHRDEFLAVLAEAAAGSATVVDVGSGVLPLMLPASFLADLGGYWALDKDPLAIDAVREYARIRGDGRLRPVLWNLSDGWAGPLADGLPEPCDLGLLLKVVPVVQRQSPELLPVLAATPARRLLISGSRIAMAKHQDIERRERRVLQRFCSDHGLRRVAEYRTPDEYFVLVER